jgi:hypothetical protein
LFVRAQTNILVAITTVMAALANILVVSDLHFGEELLPGASQERRRAIELGSSAFREFLRYHTVRRRDGRPWRLVIAGDLFDFMSVVVPATRDRPAKTADERRFGLGRGLQPGVERMRLICEAHRPLLTELGRFAAAGHAIEILVGNHDVELLAAEVVGELMRQIAGAGADDRALARIAVIPWFVYVPGVCWIEHGHVYDEGCSFEFNLAPMDPKDGWLIYNADYAAVRYLGSAVPELDPHGIEEWSLWGYMRYTMGLGFRSGGQLWLAYARFVKALFAARRLHRSFKRRDRRRREHRSRLAEVAKAGGIPGDTAAAIDRLARTPLTVSGRRLGRMVMLDRFGLGLGSALACFCRQTSGFDELGSHAPCGAQQLLELRVAWHKCRQRTGIAQRGSLFLGASHCPCKQRHSNKPAEQGGYDCRQLHLHRSHPKWNVRRGRQQTGG